jgi:hypothetical protein
LNEVDKKVKWNYFARNKNWDGGLTADLVISDGEIGLVNAIGKTFKHCSVESGNVKGSVQKKIYSNGGFFRSIASVI